MVEFSLDSPYGNILIGRDLPSCNCVLGYFIGVLFLRQSVFAVRGGHSCDNIPRFGVWCSRMPTSPRIVDLRHALSKKDKEAAGVGA
jgi:hypothetical protein